MAARRLGRRLCRLIPAACALMAVVVPYPAALGQEVDQDGGNALSVLDLPREGYQPRPITIGHILIEPSLGIRSTYDSNIYARHSGRTDDLVTYILPSISAGVDSDKWQWDGEVFGSFRRYLDHSRENTDSYGVSNVLRLQPSDDTSISANFGYQRATVDRGDPETSVPITSRPGQFDLLRGEITYQITGNKLGLQVRAAADKYNFLSSEEDDRDFTSYRASARALYRLSPRLNVFLQGYGNRRDFRMSGDINGYDRDARTLGGTVGLQIDPGGRWAGEIGAGVFRYNPSDVRLENFTGIAINGSLIYSPRARTAVTLDVFRGDVATVRNGAYGRIDSRARIGLQQEIRHNLLFSGTIGVRRTRYRGIATSETRFATNSRLEYLVNRNLSIAAVASTNKRTSDVLLDRFERFRAGLEAKLRF